MQLKQLYPDDDTLLWSHDREDIDFVAVKFLLDGTYFGGSRTMPQIIKQAESSLCFSLFRRWGEDHGIIDQIGFARVVTDYVSFGWLADVVIDGRFRRRGWGRAFMGVILGHPRLATVTLNLGTRDAQAFYAQFGFEKCEQMMRRPTA